MTPPPVVGAGAPALSNRVALVTGASRGIGAATALSLAAKGAHVVAVARTADALAALHRRITALGQTGTVVALDVTDPQSIRDLAAMIAATFGRLDILVGNAGILGGRARIEQQDVDAWTRMFDVNVHANFRLIRELHPLLAKSDAGRAVFITSGFAWRKEPMLGAYAATKAALNAMIEAYAAENSDTPLRVNLFSPGATRTGLYETAFPEVAPDTLAPVDEVAEHLAGVCLPTVIQTGALYDFRSKRWMALRSPE